MDKVIFGLKAIRIASEKTAIELLLVTDDYLRKISPTLRKEITKIMHDVEKNAGKVNKMSSLHVSGESKK
jgi:stalled ribosome rescue protein Dom34